MSEVKGFKVFNPDWTCNPDGKPYQYTCPGTFEMAGEPIPCEQGFHFCKKASDCFSHYAFNPDNKVAEIIALGTVVDDDDKSCTNKIQIVREIPWAELLTIVNEGKSCTGLCNTGNRNTGDWNTGDWNTGLCNTGNRNTGLCNTGNRNTGDWNTGNRNTGLCNTGDCNTGNRNTGDRNTGLCNTGDCNTGNRNTGDRNTGDWNKTCFSSGVFCTEEPKILLFNKPSGLTYRGWRNSRACGLLNQIDFRPNMWIWESDMTDDEKAAHPEYKTIGGFLKVLDTSDCCKRWWDSLTTYDREIICTMPNFDPAIFKEITGIEV